MKTDKEVIEEIVGLLHPAFLVFYANMDVEKYGQGALQHLAQALELLAKLVDPTIHVDHYHMNYLTPSSDPKAHIQMVLEKMQWGGNLLRK